MDILLINPSPYVSSSYVRYLEKIPSKTYTMPLGIGYIASALENDGHNVSVLDAYVKNLSYDEIENNIRAISPEVIGIGCLSDQRESWVSLVRLIKSINDRIRIVLGGPHPSILTSQTLLNVRPDVIVCGEGEETMVELLRTWQSGENINKVAGIAYHDGKDVCVTESRARIKDLDSLSYPARHLVDMDDYHGWEFIDLIYALRGDSVPRYATMSTSRGCVGECGYCSSPLIWGRTWSRRGPKSVVDEMEFLHKTYHTEFIIFTDDIFTVDQERVKSICEEILRRKLSIHWGFETAVKFVSPELLELSKRAGCICILYGVESASRRVLSNINKKIKAEDVKNAFHWTKKAGILTGAFLMVGNPGESENTIDETIFLLKQIEPDILLPQVTMVAPATMIFDIAKNRGFINDKYWLTDKPFPYYTSENSLKRLLRWHKKVFYYKEHYPFLQLLSFRDFIELHTGIRLSKGKVNRVDFPRGYS